MERWFLQMDGETVGPVLEDTVARAIDAGRVVATTPVRREGTSEWLELQHVPQLVQWVGSARTGAMAMQTPPSQVAPSGQGGFETSTALGSLVGQELAGFRLTALLGEGGMAVVFRGENTLDASITRAIKVVRPELSANPEFVRRFTEEARTLERLQHPNVVRFYGLRRERGLLVMELELLGGEPLVNRLRRAPRGLPLEEAVRLLTEASDGVAAAHALGVVHRDLKPENLFVTSAGSLKVLDFGIARAIDEADRAGKLTQVGMTLGTPAYMAPEVCNGATPSEGADVYALGLTLFEALSGSHPLIPDSAARLSSAQVMFAQVNRPVPSLRDVRGDAPPALVDIVACAVAKDPGQRFRDAGSLAAALRSVRGLMAPRAGEAGTPATRFDVPHLGAGGVVGRGSQPDAGQHTSFVLPSVGSTPGARPSLGGQQGAETGFGLPQIDRTRTTGATVMGSSRKGGASVAVPIGLACIVAASVGTGLWLHGRGKEADPAKPVASAPVPSASASSAAEPTAGGENKWIRVVPPASPLLLGVDDSAPASVRGLRHARRLMAPTAPFEMHQHEVTWGEITPWLAKSTSFTVDEPPGLPTSPADRKLLPVTGVSWDLAHAYCKSLNAALPREDEWELAARSDRLRRFPWGDDALDLQRTNVFGGKAAKLKPVMTNDQDQTQAPDAVAIFDLMGNAREWTADLYREDRPPKQPSDEDWVQSGGMSWRTVRGLPLEDAVPKAIDAYSATYRTEVCGSGSCPKGTAERRKFVGFRCVRR
jgi:serine/threonine protein kinase/formylglycine-generating enzyme required for sulfatase activity